MINLTIEQKVNLQVSGIIRIEGVQVADIRGSVINGRPNMQVNITNFNVYQNNRLEVDNQINAFSRELVTKAEQLNDEEVNNRIVDALEGA